MKHYLKITSRKKFLGITIHTHVDKPVRTFDSVEEAQAWAVSWIVLNELRNYDIKAWTHDSK